MSKKTNSNKCIQDLEEKKTPIATVASSKKEKAQRYISVTNEVLGKFLSKLNIKSSPGSDEIHPKFIRTLRHELSISQTIFFKKVTMN